MVDDLEVKLRETIREILFSLQFFYDLRELLILRSP